MESFGQTSRQIADRYNAKRAIFSAMADGRRISLYDSAEFKVSEMHTQVCVIRQDIARKGLPWVMRSRWVAPFGKRVKEYWLESIN